MEDLSMLKNMNGMTIYCPDCGKEIIIEFDTARCEECGWFAADTELDKIIGY